MDLQIERQFFLGFFFVQKDKRNMTVRDRDSERGRHDYKATVISERVM